MNEMMDAWSNFIRPAFPNGWLIFSHFIALIILAFAAMIKIMNVEHYHMNSECIMMSFAVGLVFTMCASFCFALAPVAAPAILGIMLITLVGWGIVRVVK